MRDDADRATFVRTLAEGSERSGFRVHAFALMSNHYHLLVETPQGNLSRGMGWLQNAFTRRINVRHGLWGLLFGGRYKAILGRAGHLLLGPLGLHPPQSGAGGNYSGEGMASNRMFGAVCPTILGLRASDRNGWKQPRASRSADAAIRPGDEGSFSACWSGGWTGAIPVWRVPPFPEGDGKPQLAVYSSLRRGWFFGSEHFREQLLKMLARRPVRIEKANGYHGPQLSDYAEKRARALIREALEHFGIDLVTLRRARKGDWRKGLLAAMIQKETTMRLEWIYRAAEHGDPRRRLPPGGRSPKTPRHRPRLAEGGRNHIKKRNIKWLAPFFDGTATVSVCPLSSLTRGTSAVITVANPQVSRCRQLLLSQP